MNDERRCAEQSIERRLIAADLADVAEDDFDRARARDSDEPEVGEHVARAGERARTSRTPAPQHALPRQRNVHDGLVKVTFGACLASGGAWKYGYSLKPNTFAVTFAGNCRRAALYSCTRSL